MKAQDLKNLFVSGAKVMQSMMYSLIDNTTNDVQPLRTSVPVNGLYLNSLQEGNTFVYWCDGSATATVTLPQNQKYYLATVDDFPELALYQGNAIPFTVRVIDPSNTSIFNATWVGMVDATGIYINVGTSVETITAGNSLTIGNLPVVLGTP
jgi:hypothetical protein